MQELQSYMYGSAEVVGLMICACVGLDSRAYPTARMLGRAMQYANFLRDIAEDLTLGRQYIPQEIVEQHGLSDLSEASTERDGVGFRHLYAAEERRYRSWNASAMVGFAFLKVPIRIPVATATKMYEWTIQTIAKNPYSVYTKKVKPSKARVLLSILENWFIAIVE
jgi:phytoene synthase